MKLETLAGNHRFHYLTGKHKMFNFTVAAKFLTHAKIKCTELYLTDLLSLGLIYVKKFISICQVLKIDALKRKLVLFLCVTV